jgi:hypothetical protein
VFRASENDLQASGDFGGNAEKLAIPGSISGEQDIIPLSNRAILEMRVAAFYESWPPEL